MLGATRSGKRQEGIFTRAVEEPAAMPHLNSTLTQSYGQAASVASAPLAVATCVTVAMDTHVAAAYWACSGWCLQAVGTLSCLVITLVRPEAQPSVPLHPQESECPGCSAEHREGDIHDVNALHFQEVRQLSQRGPQGLALLFRSWFLAFNKALKAGG